jgi:hypothetical protein
MSNDSVYDRRVGYFSKVSKGDVLARTAAEDYGETPKVSTKEEVMRLYGRGTRTPSGRHRDRRRNRASLRPVTTRKWSQADGECRFEPPVGSGGTGPGQGALEALRGGLVLL